MLGQKIWSECPAECEAKNYPVKNILYDALKVIVEGDPISIGLDEVTKLGETALEKYRNA